MYFSFASDSPLNGVGIGRGRVRGTIKVTVKIKCLNVGIDQYVMYVSCLTLRPLNLRT